MKIVSRWNGLARSELLSQQVYTFLRTNIRKGTFRPDERLIESKLAERMGLSRTPVREAIRKLEQEGLVYRLSRGGYAVSNRTAGEISEARSIAGLLLGHAAYLATLNAANGDFAILRGIAKSLEKHLEAGNHKRFVRSVGRFCDTLLLLSRNNRLCLIFKDLKEYLSWDIFAFPDNAAGNAFLGDQRMLIDLMETRKAKKAGRLARELYFREDEKWSTKKIILKPLQNTR